MVFPRLITIGEPMAVFSSKEIDVPLKDVCLFEKATAGAELNVAIGIARLGLEVDYLSAVGKDPNGEFLIESAQKEGVGTDLLFRNADFPTGIYFKETISKGDPLVFYLRKGSAAANMSIEKLDRIDFTKYTHAHLTGIYPAISANALSVFRELLSRLSAHGSYITYDPNLRPQLWKTKEDMVRVTNELAQKATVVLPGINEGVQLIGTEDPNEIADFYLQNASTQLVVVKLGAKGAFLKNKNGESSEIEGFKVDKVVSTVGAGDGFSTGFISAKMDGLNDQEAVKRACAIGALAVTTPGDNDGYPKRNALEKFMNES